MRRYLLLTLLLFLSSCVYAQLSISPSRNGQQDNYIYVQGEVLFVKGDLNLIKNPTTGREPSIYLRQNSKLLQGNENQKNSGAGSISIFAEGSTNAYDYNYWGVPVTSPQNGLFGISLLHEPVSEINSLPVKQTTGLNGTANPLTISTRWIHTFTGNGYTNWNFIGGNTAIAPGYGFTMKGTEGIDFTEVDGRPNNPGNSQRYDFRGKPNSGLIEVPVTAEDFVLLGNPYPSALDLSLFLLENSGEGSLSTNCYGSIERRNVTTGIAYFWDSRENGSSHYLQDYVGGYGAFSPVDPCTNGVYQVPLLKKVLTGEGDGKQGKNLNLRFLPVAMGFMVQGTENGNIIFRNSHRSFHSKESKGVSYQTQTFHKKHVSGKEPILLPKIQLIISVEDLYERQLSLVFWEEATTGIDGGMDAEAFEIAATDAGWLKDDTSFVIDVRPKNISDEIPLFLQVEKTDSKITLSKGSSENSDLNNLFILDTETNEYFEITKESLTLELPVGTYHGRFKLALTEKVSVEELPQVFFEDEAVMKKFDIFQNNHLGELEIIGNDHFPVKAIGIFDLQGKRMLYRTNFDNRRSISIGTGNWASGIYIVKVTGMDNKKTIKKITVYNR